MVASAGVMTRRRDPKSDKPSAGMKFGTFSIFEDLKALRNAIDREFQQLKLFRILARCTPFAN